MIVVCDLVRLRNILTLAVPLGQLSVAMPKPILTGNEYKVTNEHFEYDPEENVIRLKQKGSASLLLSILTAAKFGDYLDARLLMNRIVADLMRQLNDAIERPESPAPAGPRPSYAKEFLFEIGKQILYEGDHIGWWRMTQNEQKDFIRTVVAAPHSFSDEEVEDIFDAINSGLFHAEQLVQASRQTGQED